MKIFTLKLFILFSFLQTVSAEDTIYINYPGIVGGTWTAQHRYIANYDITIPYDSVLTINHGVFIEIKNGFSINVRGQLIANGIQNDLISIKPFHDDGWEGINFSTPSGEQYSRTSQLSFITINCGNYPGSQAIELGKHQINSINNLTIRGAQNAVTISGEAVISNVTDCLIENVSQGITYKFCDALTQILIEGCVFNNISDKAIYITDNGAYLLGYIAVQGCKFDNQTLGDNNSESAIYITFNAQLASVALNSNTIKSFALKDNLSTGIYINDNINLDQINLSHDTIKSCGGLDLFTPVADFGGIYIDKCDNVSMDYNEFADNTGIKSGAGFIHAKRVGSNNNWLHNNQNSTYSGNDFFAGALTFNVAERIEMYQDTYQVNSSAKSGGAFVIVSENTANAIDLILNEITLSSNIAAYNGGGALISAVIDTLKIAGSTFNGNSSSSGGGCFSMISNSFNNLDVESNTIKDNFVSKIANGGFLSLTHIPQEITPSYGSLRFYDNFIKGENHSDQNYSILYCSINSFPSIINITADSVVDSYPVSTALYVIEHPPAQPYQNKDQITLTLADNYYKNNHCPVFYLKNDSSAVTSDIHGNYVEGSQGYPGTFVNVQCNKVPDLKIHSDQYVLLADTSSHSGGAVLFRTFKEIGLVNIDTLVSDDCYSAGGNGGHISLISGSSDPSMTQKLILKNSFISNAASGNSTGGSGGGVFYDSPGNVDTLLISNCYFTDLKAEGGGGALFVNSKEINSAEFIGAHFSNIAAQGAGGALFLNATNGNIKKISALPFNEDYTSFAQCHSGLDGGAMFVKTSKEIGPVHLESIESADCRSLNGNGGHLAFISLGSEGSVNQDLIINNSTFTTSIPTDPSGGDGGAIYFNSPGNLDTLQILKSHFTGLKAAGAGGAIFLDAKEINVFGILGSDFTSDLSTASDAGALYINASNGNIKGLSIKPYNNIPCLFDGCSALNDGGAVNIKAFREIGPVLIDSVGFVNCHSVAGNGGTLSLISGSSDPAQAQNLIIQYSSFSNTNITTGGNGGGVYYFSPGNLDSLTIRTNQFSGLKAGEAGGAVFMDAKEIDRVNILGSHFTSNSSDNSYGGGIYINASDGDVRNLKIAPFSSDTTYFTSCDSKLSGGAVFIKASREVGPAYFEYLKTENCNSSNGDGGQFSLISAGSDAGLQQKLIIVNSTFNNLDNLTGGNGGAVYFDSPANPLDSLYIRSSLFSNLNVKKKAGALFINTKEITVAGILGSHFTSNSSNDSVAGSIYINAGNGNINNLFITPYNNITTTFSSCSSKLSGGALYFNASNQLGTALFDSVSFDNCHSDSGNGGSIFMSSDKIASVSVSSSQFNSSVALKSGGAVYLKSNNGLLNGNFSSNRFVNCTSLLTGGVFFVEDNKFDNPAENLVWTSNNYRKEAGEGMPEMGGTIYCKGIKTISIAGDSAMYQSSSLKGGFLYLEKVHESVLEGVYANGNSSGKGAVVYHQGDESNTNESSGIYNSNFLFNSAYASGGCFYMTDIDSVKIGKSGNKNVFVANQTLQEAPNDVTVGGGVFYIRNARSLNLNSNSFYVNNSRNNGGTGIVDNIASSLIIDNNVFLTNKARIGGTFTLLNNVPDGLISNNKFYHNSSTLNGGALFFYQASEGNFVVRDNTFYNNSTNIAGGAITTYRPLKLVRDLFRENSLNVRDPLNNNGTAISLNDSGIQTVTKNCVFDKNSSKIDSVAGIYFDNAVLPIPQYSVANCTFFNQSDLFRSIYNASDQDMINVVNSIFKIEPRKSRLDVKYFNGSVKATYCDMIYSKDTTNNNYDEYFVFNNGAYYFDSLQPPPYDTLQSFPINKGNPDPVFYDEHLPTGYWGKTNDLGVSGGPDNPESTDSFLFFEPPNLPARFDVVVRSADCFDYTFECLGDSINKYDYFYWFMPDTIMKTQGPGLRVFHYTFSPDAEGDLLITVLGHASDVIDLFGYGQDTVNLDIIRINSLASSTGNNTVSVPSTPFHFGITAGIYVAENAETPVSQWEVISSAGIEYTSVTGLTTYAVTIQKMTQPTGSIQVAYALQSCGRTRRDTVEIQLTTVNWGYPEITFYPSVDAIPNSTDSIEVKFNQRMTDLSGTACEDLIPENYLVISNPCPDQIKFNFRVICGANDTRFILIPVDVNTGVPTALCDGEFNITVLGQNLVTENYQLPGAETVKPYFLDIEDPADNSIIKVFPNPFRDIIHINFSLKDDYIIKITDLTGHVQKISYFEDINEVTLNLGDLSNGMHLLDVKNSRVPQHLIMKIIKITH
jgi:hypothetical protein